MDAGAATRAPGFSNYLYPILRERERESPSVCVSQSDTERGTASQIRSFVPPPQSEIETDQTKIPMRACAGVLRIHG